MLNGAGSHSLTVTYRIPSEDWSGHGVVKVDGRTEQLLQMLRDNIARVDTLLMPYLPELFTPEFAAQATSLRRLIFTGDTPAPAEDAFFPARFGPGACPALAHLACTLPMWEPRTPLCVPALRTLIVKRVFVPDVLNGAGEDGEAYLTDLDELVYALAHTPRLEHLDVALADVFWDAQKAALPKLQALNIRATTRVCAAVLHLAALPHDVKMHAECLSDPAFATNSTTAVLELLTEALAAPAPPSTRFAPARSAALAARGAYGSTTLRGWRRARALSAAAPDVALLLEMGADRADIRALLDGAPVFACARAFCAGRALRRLALECVEGPGAWELLARTPATRTFFRGVRFEMRGARKGDSALTEELERMCSHTFEFTDHVSEFAAVCAARTARGLEPFVEMRHDREVLRPPGPEWGTQNYEDWLHGPHYMRYTEDPWTAECTL
ncbi:hypothetical protein PsYK624_148530 [Phanerochaete sordida]|uniref:Uncharacterized protein n=1 Tax=Phanerochaete sordida TaxID=48140 RepID=A0A9P3LLE8_9APHY|nr:hypothetical protein PsYK624_148530 [Phanerochaete sordida]